MCDYKYIEFYKMLRLIETVNDFDFIYDLSFKK